MLVAAVTKSTVRMRLFSVSATYNNTPGVKMSTPHGLKKVALVPTPFCTGDEVLVPASVDTVRSKTFLMRLLSQSATYIVPSASIAMPLGLEKLAAVPKPSANAPLSPTFPAITSVITPASDIVLILLESSSTVKRGYVPEGPNAMLFTRPPTDPSVDTAPSAVSILTSPV